MRSSNSIHYMPVSQNLASDIDEEKSLPRGARLGLTTRVKIATACLLAIIAFLIVFTSLHKRGPVSIADRAPVEPFIEAPCGATAAEARAAGCRYSLMMDEWLTEDCFDEELNNEFKSLHEWEFWADKAQTQPITEEQLSEMVTAHTTLEYHIAHCTFALRKFHRSIERGAKIEFNVAARGHTDHCALYMWQMAWRLEDVNYGRARNVSLTDVGTILRPAFPGCVSYKDIDKWSGKELGHHAHHDSAPSHMNHGHMDHEPEHTE